MTANVEKTDTMGVVPVIDISSIGYESLDEIEKIVKTMSESHRTRWLPFSRSPSPILLTICDSQYNHDMLDQDLLGLVILDMLVDHSKTDDRVQHCQDVTRSELT